MDMDMDSLIPADPAPEHNSHHSIIVFSPADEEESYELELESDDEEELAPPEPSFKLSMESSRPARVSSMLAFPAVHIQPPEPAPGMDVIGPKLEYLKSIAPQFNMRTAIDDDMGYPKPYPPRRGTLVIEYGTNRSEVNFSTDWSPAELLHNVPNIIPGALEYNRTFYPMIPNHILPILEGTVSVLYRVHPTPDNGNDFDPVRLPYRATKDLPSLAFRLRVRDADEDMYPAISRMMRSKQDPVQGRTFNCVVSLSMSGAMFLDYLRTVCQKEVLETIVAEDKSFRIGMETFDNSSLVELYQAVSERGGRSMEPDNDIHGKDIPDDLMIPEFTAEFVNTAFRKSRGIKKKTDTKERRRSAIDGVRVPKDGVKKSVSKLADYAWVVTFALGMIAFIVLAWGGLVSVTSKE